MEEKTMATTKKTKAELLEELEQTQKTVNDLKKELKNLEKYKVVRETADELKAFHSAFVDAGFTDAQAFKLLETFTASILPGVMRGVKV
jgi:ribosomal protein L9